MGVSAHHRDEYIRMNCNIVAATAQNINPRGLYRRWQGNKYGASEFPIERRFVQLNYESAFLVEMPRMLGRIQPEMPMRILK